MSFWSVRIYGLEVRFHKERKLVLTDNPRFLGTDIITTLGADNYRLLEGEDSSFSITVPENGVIRAGLVAGHMLETSERRRKALSCDTAVLMVRLGQLDSEEIIAINLPMPEDS